MSADGGLAASKADDASLRRRILRETSRFAVIQALVSVLMWGTHVVLARLLDRRDFGVFGVCAFYVGLGHLLGNGGLGATLLRQKTPVTREEYQTVVTSLSALGAMFGVALVLLAPSIGAANGFHADETVLLCVMAPLYVVNALRVVPYVRLERALEFSRIARIDLMTNGIKSVLGLGVAAISGSVWALVVSHVGGALVQLVFAYRASPGWVGFGWSLRTFRRLIRFGSQVQALAILAYLKDNLSRGFLGAALGPVAVGVYDFGVAFIQLPVTAVNGFARVQLPVYSRFEARDDALYQTFRGALRTGLFAGVGLLGALAFAAPVLVPLIYGAKWSAAFPVIWALLPNMVCGLMLSPLFVLLQGQGRAGLALIVFLLWTSATWLLAILGLILVPGSLALVAAAQSVATVAVTLYLGAWAGKHLSRPILSFVAAPLLAGAAGVIAGAALLFTLPGGSTASIGAVLGFLGAYGLVAAVLEGSLLAAELRALAASFRKPVFSGVEKR